jgi:hypothetical protein
VTITAGTASAAPKPDSVGVLVRYCIDVQNRDIGRGATGDYVREVQCLLNWAISPYTFDRIAVNGEFGRSPSARSSGSSSSSRHRTVVTPGGT